MVRSLDIEQHHPIRERRSRVGTGQGVHEFYRDDQKINVKKPLNVFVVKVGGYLNRIEY